MIAAIHQGHYFPWLGYLDKMLKSDKFIILDEVQLEISSPMLRNKFLEHSGKELFLNVDIKSKNFMDKKSNEIEVFNQTKWQRKHKNFFMLNYKKAPYFDEIFPLIEPVFLKQYEYLIDVQLDTISILKNAFNLNTEIILQSDLKVGDEFKNNELLIQLLKKAECDKYLSGNGAKKYMDVSLFNDNGIKVSFQHFSYPNYKQYNTVDFVPNLSSIDILFNLGIEQSRKLLIENSQEEVYE